MKHNQAFLDYKSTLPKGRGGVAWTIESFSEAVTLLAPGFKVEDGQEWKGVMKPLWIVCPTHGRYQVIPSKFLRQSRDSGCAQCKAQKNSDSAGIVRRPRASEAEKNEARKLYSELGNYAEAARIVGRSQKSVRRWCDPEQAEKGRLYLAKWREKNREQSRANTKRYGKEFLHGRVNRAKANAMRRGNYREYDDAGNIIYQEWETYTAEDDRKLKQLQHRIKYLNRVKKDGHKWTEEHLLPLHLGGTHQPHNLAIRTQQYNFSKGASYHQGDLNVRTNNIARMFSI